MCFSHLDLLLGRVKEQNETYHKLMVFRRVRNKQTLDNELMTDF